MGNYLALPKGKNMDLDLLSSLCVKIGVSTDLVLRFHSISRLDMSEKTKLERIEQALESYIETEGERKEEVS